MRFSVVVETCNNCLHNFGIQIFHKHTKNYLIMKRSNHRFCLNCGLPVYGRADKKYCDDHCRNDFHNNKAVHNARLTRLTHRKLRRNYEILSGVIQAGVSEVPKDELLVYGFQINSVTESELREDGTMLYGIYDIHYFEKANRLIEVYRKSDLPSYW